MQKYYENEYLEYLKLLSKTYPSIQSAASKIIKLKSYLNLPKPTEHFLSDIHGEYDTFDHILKSGSGVIRDKINNLFPNYSNQQKSMLATIIYYPKQKLTQLSLRNVLSHSFYKSLISDLIDILKVVSSKYTKNQVQKLINNYQDIIEELMQSHNFTLNKENYYDEMVESIIETNQADNIIIEMSILIQKLSVTHLHILGDVFDRGMGAYRIMDTLIKHPHVDFTWGNHDILYMGAAAGNYACIANVIRNSCRYNHLSTLEDGYGISLRPLVTFAMKTYGDDECLNFIPSLDEANAIDDYDLKVIAKMHKAITIIQFKLETKLLNKHPNYQSDNLKKFEFINYDEGSIVLNGKKYFLSDTYFPTIDKLNPSRLSKDEQELMEKISLSFMHSEKIQNHVQFLFSHGSMYLKYNGNLLFHGCIPTNKDGEFTTYTTEHNNKYQGKAFLDYCDNKVRKGYYTKKDYEDKEDSIDFFWFLWCCSISPLYGKNNITTFERYFLSKEDQKDHIEEKNTYYQLINDRDYCIKILNHFSLFNNDSIIINGHMPVNIKKGESPVKEHQKLIVIDGGISKAYYNVTGISGYTLLYNSHGITLIAHEPFVGFDNAISNNFDIIHSLKYITSKKERLFVKDTDEGIIKQKMINELNDLLYCYRLGLIPLKQ